MDLVDCVVPLASTTSLTAAEHPGGVSHRLVPHGRLRLGRSHRSVHGRRRAPVHARAVQPVDGGAVLVADPVVDGGVAFSWEAVLGNAAYLTAVALLGLGLATVVRGTAMSITVLVSLVFVLPPLLPLLPWSWVETAANYFPAVAGQSLVTTLPGVTGVGDVAALWTLAAWTLVPLTAGAILLTRRDA